MICKGYASAQSVQTKEKRGIVQMKTKSTDQLMGPATISLTLRKEHL